MNKYSMKEAKDIQNTCFKLNSRQLHVLLAGYLYANNEPHIPPVSTFHVFFHPFHALLSRVPTVTASACSHRVNEVCIWFFLGNSGCERDGEMGAADTDTQVWSLYPV